MRENERSNADSILPKECKKKYNQIKKSAEEKFNKNWKINIKSDLIN